MPGINTVFVKDSILRKRQTNEREERAWGPKAVAYPGWHNPGVQTEDGVLAPLGKLKNGAPRRRCWMGEGGSMLEVIISFSDNVIGIRLLKIALWIDWS